MLSLRCRSDLRCSRGSISSRVALLSQPAPPYASASISHCDSISTSSAANSSSSSTAGSRRGLVCHAAGRAMWARGTPEPDDDRSKRASGGGMGALITREITSCDSVPELETVFMEYGANFDHINAAAAITKYAKMRGSSLRSPFFSKLGTAFLARLPDSGAQGYSNVLWACGKLGSAQHPAWAKTWQAFLALVDKDLHTGHPPSVKPQDISNVMYACAKLRQQPQPDELLLLLEAFVHPVVLDTAASQEIANVIWSLSVLSTSPGWAARVSPDLLHQLLALPLLQEVTAGGYPQHIGNVMVGLGRMCTGTSPLLSIAAAQGLAGQLLSCVQLKSLSSWSPQAITNTMWALGELQLRDEAFVHAAVAAAPMWLPKSTAFNLIQATSASIQLQYQDAHFLELLLQRGQQLLQSNSSRDRPVSESDKVSIASMCCLSVAQLNMQGFAGVARNVVADSKVKQQGRAHPASLRRLWVFHSWLLEQQLLDGKGLEGLLTQQQLQQGAREAAEWGSKTRL